MAIDTIRRWLVCRRSDSYPDWIWKYVRDADLGVARSEGLDRAHIGGYCGLPR